jgi:hypothetical protein
MGKDVRAIRESGDCVWLEGRARLCPGQRVVLVGRTGLGGERHLRQVVVVSWTIARLSDQGPLFRGVCRVAQ